VITRENNDDPRLEKEFSDVQNELLELTRFFEENRIYFPSSVCELLDKFLGSVRKNVMAAGIFGRIEHPTERTLQQSQEAFTKAYEVFDNQIPAALTTLENEFRNMLGVDDAHNGASA